LDENEEKFNTKLESTLSYAKKLLRLRCVLYGLLTVMMMLLLLLLFVAFLPLTLGQISKKCDKN